MSTRSALAGLGRVFVYGSAAVLSLFILIPIYLMTLAAFSSNEDTYVYPKELLDVNNPA